jgi:Ni/Fe-hydrogenase subunit HybB-like protein
MIAHGVEWTLKEFFVFPNEQVYWTIQIVLYPFITGLVAGAFILSSLYHVFHVKEFEGIAKYALVFSFALLLVAPIPLELHLLQPLRGFQIFFTPHFVSAIAAFGMVLTLYGLIVLSEIWFAYRVHFINQAREHRQRPGLINKGLALAYSIFTLGAFRTDESSIHKDEKGIAFLAALGIPVACVLHGYVGFIFGSVKANSLWSSPLMPVIFLMSAMVSGVALCAFTYLAILRVRKIYTSKEFMRKLANYLLAFLVLAFVLEILDLIYRAYAGQSSWVILQPLLFERDFFKLVILQYFIGNIVPFLLLCLPGMTFLRLSTISLLVLFGVFMMRWNVVIGGQSFSSTYMGFMHYEIPIVPHNFETLKEGVIGAILVCALPFVFFWIMNFFTPAFSSNKNNDG